MDKYVMSFDMLKQGGFPPAVAVSGMRLDCSTRLAAGEVRIGREHNVRVQFFIKLDGAFIDFCLREMRKPGVIVSSPVEEATWLLLSLTSIVSLKVEITQ